MSLCGLQTVAQWQGDASEAGTPTGQHAARWKWTHDDTEHNCERLDGAALQT